MKQFRQLLSFIPLIILSLFPAFIVSTDKSDDDPFRSFYRVPALLDRPCDPDFHSKFVEPIYKTQSYQEFRRVVFVWGDALRKLGKENETCFGTPEPPADAPETFQFFDCDKTTKVCKCHDEDMLKQVRHKDDCQFVESELGSECDFERMKTVNRAKNGYHRFYKRFHDAKRIGTKQLSAVLKGHQLAVQEFTFQPWAARKICHTVYKNLECKSNGKCGCLDAPPNFKYKAKGKKCVGVNQSVCSLTVEDYVDWTGRMVFDTIRTAECENFLDKCEKFVDAGEQTIKICGRKS